jgi:hypothetical protein
MIDKLSITCSLYENASALLSRDSPFERSSGHGPRRRDHLEGCPGHPHEVRYSMMFLSQAGHGSTTLRCQKHQSLFRQGDAANAVFYCSEGSGQALGRVPGRQRSRRRDFGEWEVFWGSMPRRPVTGSVTSREHLAAPGDAEFASPA